MTVEEIVALLRAVMPDAEVDVKFRPGGTDHLTLSVRSAAFAPLSRLDRQRLVYQALEVPMNARLIKAVSLKAEPLASE